MFVGTLLLVALVLAGAMTWRTIAAERRHRQVAERVIRDYCAIIAEEYARRVYFEYEQFGFKAIRSEIVDEHSHGRLVTVADMRKSKYVSVRRASVLVDQVFVADLAARTVTPPLRADLQQWVLAKLENVAVARRGNPSGAAQQVVRVPLADGDHWIGYAIAELDQRRLLGFTIRRAGLTALARRALQHRSPFPVTLGDRLTNEDVFLRIVRGNDEIFRTAGTFNPAAGRRIATPKDFGDILGGADIECSISAKGVRELVGGIPHEQQAAAMAMMGATACVLAGALVVFRRGRQLDRLRADFVAGVSHELRTPLTQIRMFAETLLLSRVRSEADRQRSLQNIARETVRLSNLVENLLSFSRGERNDWRVVRTEQDVSSVVRETVQSFSTLAAARNMTVCVDVPESCTASVDRDAFKQILLNLLDNAAKYGPDGQRIAVVLIPVDHSISLMVEDEGPGIPNGEREQVWMKFYRLDRDRDTHQTGTGIGLAVVHDLVMRHGGSCRVEEGARGARFVVQMPCFEEGR